MNFRFCHNNFNVLDLEKSIVLANRMAIYETMFDKSIAFYEKALGLKEVKRKTADDGSFILVYLSDGETYHTLELTWLRDWDRPYNLGDNEFHLALEVEDFDKAYEWDVYAMKIRKWEYTL